MFKKIFRTTLLIVTVVLLLSLSIITGVLYNRFEEVQKEQLISEMTLAAQGVETTGMDYLTSLSPKDFRLTWIAADGEVLYDTQVEESTMENHSEREEIISALESGVGESSRYSDTLTEKTLYYALRLSNGTILRISNSLDTVFALWLKVLRPMVLIFIVAIIISAIFAKQMAKRIIDPLNNLDLDNPLENESYEEIAPLLTRINKQQKKISSQVATLNQKAAEFEQTIRHMNEGLVLLDKNASVLSINPAACTIFETDIGCIGKDFLTIDRSPEMNRAIEKALSGKHSEFSGLKNGLEYQFDISRIVSDGVTLGAVLLAFDISERSFAERNRREFTANISHELKTPLQSITGSAELIESGLVKPEDLPRFTGHIRKEASRLVNLINDIIHLSQMDEGVELPEESFSLNELCEEVVDMLTPLSKSKNICLSFKGDPIQISAVKRYVHEIVYNLCENAIKYNVEDGKVNLRIYKENDKTIISVSDTGIGIPLEHQNRIFERFYRVDKSHSKETGGTGLGLSIVKHAVQYMNGQISLESTPETGTTIKVYL